LFRRGGIFLLLHFPAFFRATAAGLRAFPAMVVVRRVFLAFCCARVADFGTEATQRGGKCRTAGLQAGAQGAKIGAIAAKFGTVGHAFGNVGGGAAFAGGQACQAGLYTTGMVHRKRHFGKMI
jgi:hypothetical protein